MTEPNTMEFGEWLPDLKDTAGPGLITAKNTIPQDDGYIPMLDHQEDFTDGIFGPALGADWTLNNISERINFVGSDDNIFRYDDNTVHNVSAFITVSNATHWEFAKFGDNMIAADPGHVLFQIDVNIPLLVDLDFEILPGLPPRAKRIATINNFLVLGDTTDNNGNITETTGPNFIQWSGFNNATLWGTSKSTQADFNEELGKGGRVQKITSGTYGVIFQENTIKRMDYIGPPQIFSLRTVENASGTNAPDSVVQYKNLFFYYGWDGFYVFDGAKSVSISDGKISQWFQGDADVSGISTMQGGVDRRSKKIYWIYKTDSRLAYKDHMVVYDLVTNRWSYGECTLQILAEHFKEGVFSDELTNFSDLMSISMDSDAYSEDALQLAAFSVIDLGDDTGHFGQFTGEPLQSVFETRDFSNSNNHQIFINSAQPIVEGAEAESNLFVQVGKRKKLSDLVSYTTEKQPNPRSGECSFRVSTKYPRLKLTTTGFYSKARGLLVRSHQTGGL